VSPKGLVEIIMIDNYQYYPTPKALSELAWETFKNRQFVRVLEPSAGEGHLLKSRHATRWTPIPVDCIEIDIAKHPALRQQGFEVVGMDFMQFQSGSHYSHVIISGALLIVSNIIALLYQLVATFN
jgi:hypothetical protein